MSRAQWATAENIKKHYDMIADILIKTGIAVANPNHDETQPRSERIYIMKPNRLFSMDETRLTNDMTDKNKSKANRSVLAKGQGSDTLANKGGGDGTGIGGSSADGFDLPGYFIFSNDIIHEADVQPQHCPAPAAAWTLTIQLERCPQGFCATRRVV